MKGPILPEVLAYVPQFLFHSVHINHANKTVMFHNSKSKHYYTSCTCTEVGFECVECVLLLWIDST